MVAVVTPALLVAVAVKDASAASVGTVPEITPAALPVAHSGRSAKDHVGDANVSFAPAVAGAVRVRENTEPRTGDSVAGMIAPGGNTRDTDHDHVVV